MLTWSLLQPDSAQAARGEADLARARRELTEVLQQSTVSQVITERSERSSSRHTGLSVIVLLAVSSLVSSYWAELPPCTP